MEQDEKTGGARTLTDADVEALTRAIEQRLVKKFYQDLGKGLWGAVWKVLLGALIVIAANGANGWHWPWGK